MAFLAPGLLGRAVEARDVEGATVGEFSPSGLRRGGGLRWVSAGSRCVHRALGGSATHSSRGIASLPSWTARPGAHVPSRSAWRIRRWSRRACSCSRPSSFAASLRTRTLPRGRDVGGRVGWLSVRRRRREPRAPSWRLYRRLEGKITGCATSSPAWRRRSDNRRLRREGVQPGVSAHARRTDLPAFSSWRP